MGEHTVPVRKAQAGSDSFGHVWAEDGAVVDVPYGQALALLAVPDGGFTAAEDEAAAAVPSTSEPGEGGEAGEGATEPAPDAEGPVIGPAPAKTKANARSAKTGGK